MKLDPGYLIFIASIVKFIILYKNTANPCSYLVVPLNGILHCRIAFYSKVRIVLFEILRIYLYLSKCILETFNKLLLTFGIACNFLAESLEIVTKTALGLIYDRNRCQPACDFDFKRRFIVAVSIRLAPVGISRDFILAVFRCKVLFCRLFLFGVFFSLIIRFRAAARKQTQTKDCRCTDRCDFLPCFFFHPLLPLVLFLFNR